MQVSVRLRVPEYPGEKVKWSHDRGGQDGNQTGTRLLLHFWTCRLPCLFGKLQAVVCVLDDRRTFPGMALSNASILPITTSLMSLPANIDIPLLESLEFFNIDSMKMPSIHSPNMGWAGNMYRSIYTSGQICTEGIINHVTTTRPHQRPHRLRMPKCRNANYK